MQKWAGTYILANMRNRGRGGCDGQLSAHINFPVLFGVRLELACSDNKLCVWRHKGQAWVCVCLWVVGWVLESVAQMLSFHGWEVYYCTLKKCGTALSKAMTSYLCHSAMLGKHHTKKFKSLKTIWATRTSVIITCQRGEWEHAVECKRKTKRKKSAVFSSTVQFGRTCAKDSLIFLFLIDSNRLWSNPPQSKSTSLNHTKHINVANKTFLLQLVLSMYKLLHLYLLHLKHFAEAFIQCKFQERKTYLRVCFFFYCAIVRSYFRNLQWYVLWTLKHISLTSTAKQCAEWLPRFPSLLWGVIFCTRHGWWIFAATFKPLK